MNYLTRPGLLLLATLSLSTLDAQTNSASPRERLLLDFGWKFHLGNEWGIGQSLAKAGTGSGPASVSFSDASWRTINLPHDWAIELPFNSSADGAHGFKALGRNFPSNSVAWYRRSFELSRDDSGKRIWIEFDGAFRDTTVFVNGWFVGHHESGYSSFRYDITDVVNAGGKNLIVVKVDALDFEGWFYEGAGIYRHTWLVKTAPVAIAPDGIFVYSHFENNTPGENVEVNIETRLRNTATNAANAKISHAIINPAGQTVGGLDDAAQIAGKSETESKSTLSFSNPELWSPESPKLYQLVTTVEADGKIVDRKETEFGIRTFAFDAQKGFLLNGKPYVLKGTCNHQDHAGVGAAMPDALQYFRVAKLKEIGGNAYRTSHNPPTPELLEACDRLGLLVMDENRLLGSDPKHMDELERLIRRDRNHASVGIWSIANEEFSVQSTPAAARVAAAMQYLVKRLDPTRPVTYPAPQGNDWAGINSVIEVRGWNYHVGPGMEAYHAAHSEQPNVGTEQGSTVSTRGIYFNDTQRGYVSAYDTNATSWSNTAEQWWGYFSVRPWLSGGFVWTGFDYRGEPTPYNWPCINSHFGILDVCGFPKDNFFYYQSWWGDKTVLHLLPHWNWPGKEGQEIEVWAHSNCEEVELFLNGQSLGRRSIAKNFHAEWKVKYAPGTLAVKGYRDGKVVAEDKCETTGAPAAVQLAPDRAVIKADGEDISIITVAVTDREGRVVPVAANAVQFDLSGPGKILGVGNGDPSSHESDVFIPQWPVRTIPVNDWRWQKVMTDVYAATNIPEVAEKFDDSQWKKTDVRSDTGQIQGEGKAVFRAKLTVTEQDLAASSVELCFGSIDEDGFICINGQRVGESHDWRAAPAFDVKKVLRPGENTIAVGVGNWSGGGGLTKGVWLQFQSQPTPVQWQRSVFNGLAQIIVQSTREPGEIVLTAKSSRLKPATLKITAEQATLRPSVPAR